MASRVRGRVGVWAAVLLMLGGCREAVPPAAAPEEDVEPEPPVVINPVAHARFVEAVQKLHGSVEVLDPRRGISAGVRVVFPRVVQLTDDDLRALQGATALRELELWDTPITGVGLKHLAGLPQLRRLAIVDSRAFTDAGFRELARLTQVRSLDLTFTPVNDGRLKLLGDLGKLRELRVEQIVTWTKKGPRREGQPVTDEGLKAVARLTDLRVLSLAGTRTTDAGLKHLAGLHRLRELNVSQTQVTAAALQDVARFRQLRKLGFVTEKVDGAGVKQLADLPELRQLGIRVTADGLKELVRLTRLEDLQLIDDGKLTADAVRSLAALKGLRKLEIRGAIYLVIADGLRDLQNALPHCEIGQQ
jgi:internalin A